MDKTTKYGPVSVRSVDVHDGCAVLVVGIYPRPLYVRSVYRNQYKWTRDPLHAKHFNPAAAARHVLEICSNAERLQEEHNYVACNT